MDRFRHLAFPALADRVFVRRLLGLAGVSFDMVNHVGNLEFIALGSTVKHTSEGEALQFSTADDAQALYCQMDAGFEPRRFVFGNLAYSIGVGGGYWLNTEKPGWRQCAKPY